MNKYNEIIKKYKLEEIEYNLDKEETKKGYDLINKFPKIIMKQFIKKSYKDSKKNINGSKECLKCAIDICFNKKWEKIL